MTMEALPTLQETLPRTLALIESAGLGIDRACLPAQRPFDAYGYWQFKLQADGTKAIWPTGHTIQEYHRWPTVTFGLSVMEAYYADVDAYMNPPEPEPTEEPTEEPVEEEPNPGSPDTSEYPEIISTEEPTA